MQPLSTIPIAPPHFAMRPTKHLMKHPWWQCTPIHPDQTILSHCNLKFCPANLNLAWFSCTGPMLGSISSMSLPDLWRFMNSTRTNHASQSQPSVPLGNHHTLPRLLSGTKARLTNIFWSILSPLLMLFYRLTRFLIRCWYFKSRWQSTTYVFSRDL